MAAFPTFTHMLVSVDTGPNNVGLAYCIGTYAECLVYQVKHGLIGTTYPLRIA